MAVDTKKRQKILFGALIILIIIAIVFWYINYQKPAPVETLESQGELSNISSVETRLKEIKIDFSILDNELFKLLKSYGILPVTAEVTGRINPFESY